MKLRWHREGVRPSLSQRRLFGTSALLMAVVGCGSSNHEKTRADASSEALAPDVGPETDVEQEPENQPPVIETTTQSSSFLDTPDEEVSFTVTARDPEGEPLDIDWLATDGRVLYKETIGGREGRARWVPPPGPDLWLVTAKVTDKQNASTEYTFVVRPSRCYGLERPGPERPFGWRFGIMADTQWGAGDDGQNPNTVAAGMIRQINDRFISHGVDLVVQVGDLSDDGSAKATATRAAYAQSLYNAQIGFYPLRGNHDYSAEAAAEFVRVFPQTRTGTNNDTPDDAMDLGGGGEQNPPPEKAGRAFTVGARFSSPSEALRGLSYAFDYRDARFVLIDQFTPADKSNNSVGAQLSWIQGSLAQRPPATHAFVFGHKGIFGQSHADGLFGSVPSENTAQQDAFIHALHSTNTRVLFAGHDHLHNRSRITTTNGQEWLTQIIAGGASFKFYSVTTPAIDVTYNAGVAGRTRETQISQELRTVGYYIATVAANHVTFDFYSSNVPGNAMSGDLTATPTLNFARRETFGYALDGAEFMVPMGGYYDSVRLKSPMRPTEMRILGNVNAQSGTDGSGRFFTKAINAGWRPGTCETATDILRLWGLADALGRDETAPYPLAMTFDLDNADLPRASKGVFGLVVRDAEGRWVNAVRKNRGDPKGRFVFGSWDPDYAPGTYGIDLKERMAWAVLDYADTSEFAVARFPSDQNHE